MRGRLRALRHLRHVRHVLREERKDRVLELQEELHAVAAALDAHGIAYALIGGLAVSLYARPRATEDIDLLLAPEDLSRAAAAVAPLGYRLLPSSFHFPRVALEMRRFTKLAPGDFMLVDVLLASTAELRDMLARRVRVGSPEQSLWLVPLDGLQALKRMRASPQDLADLQALSGEEEEEP